MSLRPSINTMLTKSQPNIRSECHRAFQVANLFEFQVHYLNALNFIDFYVLK